MTSQKPSARASAALPGCDLAPGQAYGSQAFSYDRPRGKSNRQMVSLLGLANLTANP
jgi:hypothetical protein